MNLLVLYLLLLKASVTSFSGLGSLPMVRNDFVVERHLLTDHQLNMAVVAGRTGPGPFGLYLVCVAYLVGGVPGAFMGFLALITPAFLVIPLMRWIGARADIPRVRARFAGYCWPAPACCFPRPCPSRRTRSPACSRRS